MHSPPEKHVKTRAQAVLSLYPSFKQIQLLQSVQKHSVKVDWSSNVRKKNVVKAGYSIQKKFRHLQCTEVKSANNRRARLMSCGQLEETELPVKVQLRFVHLLSNSCMFLLLSSSLYKSKTEQKN